MKTAMTPLLELSTVLVVLVVCAIAVVPGAGEYTISVLDKNLESSSSSENPSAIDISNNVAEPSGAYASYNGRNEKSGHPPERLANRNTETMLPGNNWIVANECASPMGNDGILPAVDKMTMTISEDLKSTTVGNEIEFFEPEAVQVSERSEIENFDATSVRARIVIDEMETASVEPSQRSTEEPKLEFRNTDSAFAPSAAPINDGEKSDLPVIKQPEKTIPLDTVLVPETAGEDSADNFAQDEESEDEFALPKLITNESAFSKNRVFGFDNLFGAEKSGTLIRNQFMDGNSHVLVGPPANKKLKGPMNSEREDSDWTMVELPAFKSNSKSMNQSVPGILEPAAVERQPMSAASMQDDSQYRTQ